MSADLVDPEHIHVMLWAGMERRYGGRCSPLSWYWGNPDERGVLDHQSADAVGQMLLDANAASVNARYDEDNAYVCQYQRPRYRSWQPVELLKAIECYEYQACEVHDWPQTQAYAFCQALRKAVIRGIADYSDAGTWSITSSSTPLAEVKRLAMALERGSAR
jgi:hypothetical protein